jgi:hypothetical protein
MLIVMIGSLDGERRFNKSVGFSTFCEFVSGRG